MSSDRRFQKLWSTVVNKKQLRWNIKGDPSYAWKNRPLAISQGVPRWKSYLHIHETYSGQLISQRHTCERGICMNILDSIITVSQNNIMYNSNANLGTFASTYGSKSEPLGPNSASYHSQPHL